MGYLQMVFNFTEMIVAVFVSLGGMSGLILLAKELTRIYLKKTKQTFESVIEGEGKIYYHLAQIRDNTSCDKVAMLKLHNGGAEVRIGHMVYTSITHETHNPNFPSQIDKWRRIRLDKVYTERIVNMISSKDKRAVSVVDDLEESFFKDAMIKYNISHIWHNYVYTHKPKKIKFLTNFKEENLSELWYLSIVWTGEGRETSLTPNEREVIRENTAAIANIIKDGRKYD